MSKTQKRTAGPHNPSPYMRRFQLPSLTFKDSSAYDELLSPLETESKQQLMDEKNSQLRNYFADTGIVGPSSSNSRMEKREHKPIPSINCSNGFKNVESDSKLYEDPFEAAQQQYPSRKIIVMPESRSFDMKPKVREMPSKDIPPPIPPHRPLPRQKLVEIEKYRMCKEIWELERRSREMYDLLMSPSKK